MPVRRGLSLSPRRYTLRPPIPPLRTAEDALKGALDIIAENISDDADIRRRLRNLFTVIGNVEVTAADKNAESVYTMYYKFSEPVSKIAGHRVLAIDRGEREKFLKVSVTLDPVKAANVITSATLNPNGSPCTEAVREAGADAYERLIYPSIEREIRNMLTEKAAANAIKVFALNTKELLLAPPVKGKVVIGLDPGYRTGCKVAVVDRTGSYLCHPLCGSEGAGKGSHQEAHSQILSQLHLHRQRHGFKGDGDIRLRGAA